MLLHFFLQPEFMVFNTSPHGGQKELVLRLVLLVFHFYCPDGILLLPEKLYIHTTNVLEDNKYRLDMEKAFNQTSYSGV